MRVHQLHRWDVFMRDIVLNVISMAQRTENFRFALLPFHNKKRTIINWPGTRSKCAHTHTHPTQYCILLDWPRLLKSATNVLVARWQWCARIWQCVAVALRVYICCRMVDRAAPHVCSAAGNYGVAARMQLCLRMPCARMLSAVAICGRVVKAIIIIIIIIGLWFLYSRMNIFSCKPIIFIREI